MESNVLQSSKSNYKVYYRFNNKTGRYVIIYWVDFNGKFVKYFEIAPEQKIPLNTFYTHVWIFKDAKTGELMHVNNSSILIAQPIYKMQNNEISLFRTEIKIHLPISTLKEKTLWTIVVNLTNINYINKLEIPLTLKYDLKRIFEIYNNHKNNRSIAF